MQSSVTFAIPYDHIAMTLDLEFTGSKHQVQWLAYGLDEITSAIKLLENRQWLHDELKTEQSEPTLLGLKQHI